MNSKGSLFTLPEIFYAEKSSQDESTSQKITSGGNWVEVLQSELISEISECSAGLQRDRSANSAVISRCCLQMRFSSLIESVASMLCSFAETLV